MDVGTLYDSAPRKPRYSYPSGTVYGRLYVFEYFMVIFPLENSLDISFLFSVRIKSKKIRLNKEKKCQNINQYKKIRLALKYGMVQEKDLNIKYFEKLQKNKIN